MKNIKKVIFLFLSTICLTFLLCACNSDSNQNTSSDSNQNTSSDSNQNTSVNSDEPTKNESLEKALELERPYYKTIEKGIYSLEKYVKNPSSLKINDIIVHVTKSNNSIMILFEYSAQNGLGNDVSGTCSYGTTFGTISSDSGLYSTCKKIAGGHNSNYTEKEEGFYEDSDYCVYRLNVDDYLNEGYYFP